MSDTETKTDGPRQQAWRASFFDENHLNYATSPDLVASPAQIRFMVVLEPEQQYIPCTRQVFDEIMLRVKSPLLREMYNQVWVQDLRSGSEKNRGSG